VEWLEEDFTEPVVYAPRRPDWNDDPDDLDPVIGMPARFRALEFTPALQEVASREIPNAWWATKPECKFPDLTEPPGGRRDWMYEADGVTPVRPLGEIYLQRPGEYFFTSTCYKCHGYDADGQSGLARAIRAFTGGRTRVANLRDGLFGHGGSSIAMFQDGARNLAGNYLIWMAMGGTLAEFPVELSNLIGSHGANMLNQVRVSCALLLPGASGALSPRAPAYEMLNSVCALNNEITPEMGYQRPGNTPINAAAQEAWLDRAAQNAGWTLFEFLRDDLTAGKRPVLRSDCERRYPAP
jgi:hypothetical protein